MSRSPTRTRTSRAVALTGSAKFEERLSPEASEWKCWGAGHPAGAASADGKTSTTPSCAAARAAGERDLHAARDRPRRDGHRVEVDHLGRRQGLFQRRAISLAAAQVDGALRSQRDFDAVISTRQSHFIAHQVEGPQRLDGPRQQQPRRRVHVPGHAHRPVALEEIDARRSCPALNDRRYAAPSRNEAQAFSAASRGRGM